MKYLVISLIGIILLSGCISNSFKSCHERCMDIEKLKIDINCETDTINEIEYITKECNITKEQFLNYTENCFSQCLDLKEVVE